MLKSICCVYLNSIDYISVRVFGQYSLRFLVSYFSNPFECILFYKFISFSSYFFFLTDIMIACYHFFLQLFLDSHLSLSYPTQREVYVQSLMS